MGYWANFARNGTPNGRDLVHWPLYNQNEDYLGIDVQQKSAKGLKTNRVKFISETLPEKLKTLKEDDLKHSDM
ncbi:SASB hydrolase, partial [Amia calva]|nr:SASB hydrolase [Amia calva]